MTTHVCQWMMIVIDRAGCEKQVRTNLSRIHWDCSCIGDDSTTTPPHHCCKTIDVVTIHQFPDTIKFIELHPTPATVSVCMYVRCAVYKCTMYIHVSILNCALTLRHIANCLNFFHSHTFTHVYNLLSQPQRTARNKLTYLTWKKRQKISCAT